MTHWRLHFEHNAQTLLPIPWEIGPELTPEERAAVATSLQEFQAGEHSEGRHLYRFAQAYAAETGDHEYVRAIRLFIAEEQRHARDLGRFLTLNGLPLVHTTVADRIFRWLRNLVSSLEVSIAVLITAELIAKVYYAALREATASVILRRLCDQILSDEEAHVRFQSQQLARLRAGRSPVATSAAVVAQRLLYAGTVLLIGWSHRRVRRRAGLTFSGWWRWCWWEFDALWGWAATLDVPATRRTSGPVARVRSTPPPSSSVLPAGSTPSIRASHSSPVDAQWPPP